MSEVQDGEETLVLDSGPMRDLAEDAGCNVAQGFFDDYLQTLPVRFGRILGMLADEELQPVRDAVVSLKVASAMAGALRLESYSLDLERRLVTGSRPDASAVKAALYSNIQLILHEARRQGHLRVSTLSSVPSGNSPAAAGGRRTTRDKTTRPIATGEKEAHSEAVSHRGRSPHRKSSARACLTIPAAKMHACCA